MRRRALLLVTAAGGLVPGVAWGGDLTLAPEALPSPQRLGISAGAGYLGSGAGSGVALAVGARWAVGTRAALGADLGYGVLGAPSTTQDRWWILPSVAWVLPAGAARVDLGVGLGLGASSGYASFGDYTRGPFAPTWAFQLVPAARLHAMAATPVGPNVDVFVRVEAAALFPGTGLGFRHGSDDSGVADTTWITLGAGAQFRLL